MRVNAEQFTDARVFTPGTKSPAAAQSDGGVGAAEGALVGAPLGALSAVTPIGRVDTSSATDMATADSRHAPANRADETMGP
jgi:hypothetical protein